MNSKFMKTYYPIIIVTIILSIYASSCVVTMTSRIPDIIPRKPEGTPPGDMGKAKTMLDVGVSNANQKKQDASSIRDDTVNFTRQYFTSKGGEVQITNIENDCVDFVVRNIKNEVIKTGNSWEKIQGSFYISEQNSSIMIRCVLDGQYAGGLRLPADQSFSDMQPQYSEQLGNYAGELVNKLRNYIVNGHL